MKMDINKIEGKSCNIMFWLLLIWMAANANMNAIRSQYKDYKIINKHDRWSVPQPVQLGRSHA